MKAVHVGKTERKIIDLPIPSPEADEVLIKGELGGGAGVSGAGGAREAPMSPSAPCRAGAGGGLT